MILEAIIAVIILLIISRIIYLVWNNWDKLFPHKG